jgi:hypothetical protein
VAKFIIDGVRRFQVGEFAFINGVMTIPDSDTAKLAKWRKTWASLTMPNRGLISEVIQKNATGAIIDPTAANAVRGIPTGDDLQRRPVSAPVGASAFDPASQVETAQEPEGSATGEKTGQDDATSPVESADELVGDVTLAPAPAGIEVPKIKI